MNNPTIIGAGISGLITAIELEKAGYSPTILEASHRVGGRVKTDYLEDLKLDHGFQVLLTEYPEAKKYLDYDKLDLKTFSPGSIIIKNGKKMRIGDPTRDISFAISTLVSSTGSLKDKLLILKLSNKLKKKSIQDIFTEKEVTTLDYLTEFGFSDAIINSFFKPFYTGIFLEDKLITSSRMFAFVFKMFSEGHAAIPQEGMQAISNQLVKKLKHTTIKLNSPVKSVKESKIVLANGEEIASTITLIATDANEIFENTASTSTNWKSCYNLYFKTKTSDFNEAIIGLVSNDQSLINNYHYLEDVYGTGSSTLSVTVVKEHSLSENQLIDHVKKELLEHCGIAVLEAVKVYHIKRALPQLTDLQYTPPADNMKIGETIFTCGDHLSYGSLNAAMANGREAAQLIINQLSTNKG